jgi:hypothetical protein
MSMPVRHDDGNERADADGAPVDHQWPTDPPAFPMFGKRFDELLARLRKTYDLARDTRLIGASELPSCFFASASFGVASGRSFRIAQG